MRYSRYKEYCISGKIYDIPGKPDACLKLFYWLVLDQIYKLICKINLSQLSFSALNLSNTTLLAFIWIFVFNKWSLYFHDCISFKCYISYTTFSLTIIDSTSDKIVKL